MEFFAIDEFFHNRNRIKCEVKLKYSTEVVKNTTYIKPVPITAPSRRVIAYDNDSDCETGRYTQYDNRFRRNTPYEKEFVVSIFGRNTSGESICVHVLGFKPYFYVKIPEGILPELYLGEIESIIHRGITTIKHRRYNNIQFQLCKRIDYYGFRNFEKSHYVKIIFDNENTRRKYIYAIKKLTILGETPRIYEGNCPASTRFFQNRQLKPTGWYRISRFANVPSSEKLTNCTIEISTIYENLSMFELTDIPPITQLSFDIETAPAKSREKHPNLSKGDPIINIGCSFLISPGVTFDESKLYNIVFSLNKSNQLPNAKVIDCRNESELIMKFVDIVRRGPVAYFPELGIKNEPDIILAYNGLYYDWNYIHVRATALGLIGQLSRISKFIEHRCPFISETIRTNQIGIVDLNYYRIPGIVLIDPLIAYARMNDTSLPDIKLETVSKHYLGKDEEIVGNMIEIVDNAQKHEKFWRYYREDIEKFREKFPELVHMRIMHRFYEFTHMKIDDENNKMDLPYQTMYQYYLDATANPDAGIEKMTTIAKYCIQDCILLHKLVDRCCIFTNYISQANIADFPFGQILTRGVGILVYNLIAGYTAKSDFVIPDMSKSDIDLDAVFDTMYEKNPAFQKAMIKAKNDNDKTKTREKWINAHFAPRGAHVLNPVPGIHMNVATLDVNSMYPSAIRSFNLSPDTCVRDSRYDNLPDVKYCTIPYQMNDGEIYKARFAIRYDNGRPIKGILVSVCENLLTERSKVKKIRDKKPHNSLSYRILDSIQLALKIMANSVYGQLASLISKLYMQEIGGCITSCSRLYLKKCEQMVKSAGIEVIYGDSVSADTPIILRIKNEVYVKTFEKIAEYLEWESYGTGKQQSICDNMTEIWSRSGWTRIRRFIRHKCNKRMFAVNTASGIVKVTEDHSLISANGTLLKPKVALGARLLQMNADIGEILCNVSKGLVNNFISAVYTDPVVAQKVYYLLQDAGYYCRVEYVNGAYKISKSFYIDEPNRVIAIYELPRSEYVYDIETEDGTFAAGIGPIIVKNTDSIFIKAALDRRLDETDSEYFRRLWHVYQKVEKDINDHFKTRAHKLYRIELEKMFSILVLHEKKKNYFGIKYTNPDMKNPELMIMGIQAKKRDANMLLKITYQYIIDAILYNKRDTIRGFLQDLCNYVYKRGFEQEYYKIGKKYKGKDAYAREDTTPHARAAKIIRIKNPGNAPAPNERIYYTYLKRRWGKGPRGGLKQPKACTQVYPFELLQSYHVIDYKLFLKLLFSAIEKTTTLCGLDGAELKLLYQEVVEKNENIFMDNGQLNEIDALF